MVIFKHALRLLSAAAITAVVAPSSAVFAQTPAQQVEIPAVEQAEAAPVSVSRAEGETISVFLSRIQLGIAGGNVEEEAMAEQVASLLPPETTVTDASRSIVDEVLAFAQANPASAEAVGDGLALAANAASNANNAALARMIRVRVEGAPGLLAQAFADNFTATAAGGGAAGGGAGAGGGGGAIGGAGGAVAGGTGGLGEGSSPVTQTNNTTAPSGGGSSTAGFADGNTTIVVDVSPG